MVTMYEALREKTYISGRPLVKSAFEFCLFLNQSK